MYTPANEYEEQVPASVIRLVAKKGRADQADPTHLMADINCVFPPEFHYSPSTLLPLRSLPSSLKAQLGFLVAAKLPSSDSRVI